MNEIKNRRKEKKNKQIKTQLNHEKTKFLNKNNVKNEFYVPIIVWTDDVFDKSKLYLHCEEFVWISSEAQSLGHVIRCIRHFVRLFFVLVWVSNFIDSLNAESKKKSWNHYLIERLKWIYVLITIAFMFRRISTISNGWPHGVHSKFKLMHWILSLMILCSGTRESERERKR